VWGEYVSASGGDGVRGRVSWERVRQQERERVGLVQQHAISNLCDHNRLIDVAKSVKLPLLAPDVHVELLDTLCKKEGEKSRGSGVGYLRRRRLH
jgi:hypothetical protein